MTRANRTVSIRSVRGFSLVGAIFVLVVLALLGGFLVTIGTSQRATVAYAAQGARAYQAARAGVEWAISRVILIGPGTDCALAPGVASTGPFTPVGLEGFQITVNCTYTQHDEAGATYSVYAITSTANFGTFGDPYFFTRTIQASVTDAPP